MSRYVAFDGGATLSQNVGFMDGVKFILQRERVNIWAHNHFIIECEFFYVAQTHTLMY